MKNLNLILLLFVFYSAHAEVEFVPTGADGTQSYIDAVQLNGTRIHYNTNTLKNEDVDWVYDCPTAAPDGKRPHNQFMLTREVNENGKMRTRAEPRHIRQGSSCEDIRTQDPTIQDCRGENVLALYFQEKNGTATGPTRMGKSDVGIGGKEIQDKLKECSPSGLIAVVDNKGKGLLSDLNKKTQCELPKQKITLPNATWDAPNSPESHIRTSNGGIMIGNHTHVYYDERRKSFCIHFRPDIGNANTVCRQDFAGGRSFPIEFIHPTNPVRGVFRLSMDAKKNPVIEVGASTKNEASKPGARISHALDWSKPFVRVAIDPGNPTLNPSNSKNGKSLTYTSHTGGRQDSPAVRVLQMHPQFRLGTMLEQGCDSAMCISKPNDTSPASCTKRDPTFNLAANPTTLCYSCNGVTPGPCGDTKALLDTATFAKVNSRMLACTGAQAPQQQVAPTAAPQVEQ